MSPSLTRVDFPKNNLDEAWFVFTSILKLNLDTKVMPPTVYSELLASELLDLIDSNTVALDLGCGTGILGIGCLLLGASKVYFVDNDEDALKIAKESLKIVKSEFSIEGKASFLCSDILGFDKKVDTVVQNPPFGVKVRHADRDFLKKAMEMGKVEYSFHKSDSKRFIYKFVDEKSGRFAVELRRFTTEHGRFTEKGGKVMVSFERI